jgi:hypothetical protein
MVTIPPSLPTWNGFWHALRDGLRKFSTDKSGAMTVSRSPNALSAPQVFAVVVALVVLFVIIASSEPFGFGRDLSSHTRLLIVLTTVSCGVAAGIVGIRRLWKK